uniref:Peptidase M3A/M3B catalytic domain-containing protein n=1 Tax=Tetradesmus obliquus TaxID=3088 RepID=A0A383VSJ1_TETOB|eukprot:jgi/Sobl393_1/911/SZX67883.1
MLFTPAPTLPHPCPGLLKYEVVCSQLGLLGTIYLDLAARPGKVPSSGILYPVRCGRELPGGAYQQPVLCLVSNLPASNSSSSSSADLTGLPLTWREFKTLLHEMGHAVHSMVSRTKYQHVWGTRCSQDVVEVPSHLWEHFATDARSLSLLARHADSRQPMPQAMARQLARLSTVTPALELQQQALLSLVDLVYHGQALPSAAGGTSSVWSSLAAQHASLPPPAGTCPQARFNHLTIYGASYYSYLYARCLSEAIWETHLAADPLDASAGHNIRKLLLEPGGALEPLDLLTAALGGLECRDKVLQQRHGGWCPDPRSLLKSIHKNDSRA